MYWYLNIIMYVPFKIELFGYLFLLFLIIWMVLDLLFLLSNIIFHKHIIMKQITHLDYWIGSPRDTTQGGKSS